MVSVEPASAREKLVFTRSVAIPLILAPESIPLFSYQYEYPPSKLLPKTPLASLQDTRGITRRSTRTIDDGYEDQDLRVRLACRAASASSGPGGASASSESMSEYLSESNRVSRSIQRPLENEQTLNTELLGNC